MKFSILITQACVVCDYWEIELETILPGQRAMAHESEVQRV